MIKNEWLSSRGFKIQTGSENLAVAKTFPFLRKTNLSFFYQLGVGRLPNFGRDQSNNSVKNRSGKGDEGGMWLDCVTQEIPTSRPV